MVAFTEFLNKDRVRTAARNRGDTNFFVPNRQMRCLCLGTSWEAIIQGGAYSSKYGNCSTCSVLKKCVQPAYGSCI